MVRESHLTAWEFIFHSLDSVRLIFLYIRDITSSYKMATMAAAIAASLPTVQAASTPAVPTQETLPAAWTKNIDPEAEIPIATVQIDGLVCLGELHLRTRSPNDVYHRSPQKLSSTALIPARLPTDYSSGSTLMGFSKSQTVSRCQINPLTKTKSLSNLLVGAFASALL